MKIDKKTLEEKSNLLEDLKVFLKTEFIGIDQTIDEVVSLISPYIIFPEVVTKPIIINLWGMTGTGKTMLVKKIVEFLNFKSKFYIFDIGKYASGDSELYDQFSDKIKNHHENNKIFLFDEFQLGRTINEMGEEVDRNSLRLVWDLLDQGKITIYRQVAFYNALNLYYKIKDSLILDIKLENGYVKPESEEKYEKIFKTDFSGKKIIDYKNAESIDLDILKTDKYEEFYNVDKIYFKEPRFIKYDFFHTLYKANPDYFNRMEVYELHMDKFNFNSVIECILFLENDFLPKIPSMEEIDLTGSLIFCVGNIDEAYAMSDELNPDTDPDILYEYSKEITITDIKNSLSRRFRMEQIGRLGNNHIIYPSINKDNYKKIIQKNLNDKISFYKNNYELDVVFDDSINDIIYKEGVYPTQGVRPLLTSISNMVDSYFTRIIPIIGKDNDEFTKMEWYYINKQYKFVIDKKEYFLPVTLKLENLRESDFSDQQALVAVHESGHALIAALTMGLAPTKITSKNADVSNGFCQFDFPLLETKSFLTNKIKVDLGGIIAEQILFGEDNISTGACIDLMNATSTASNMIRENGMGEVLFRMLPDSSLDSSNNSIVMDISFEEDIKSLINICKSRVFKLLSDNKKYLIELSKYLSINSSMETDKFKEILSGLNIEWKTKENLYNFKKILNSL